MKFSFTLAIVPLPLFSFAHGRDPGDPSYRGNDLQQRHSSSTSMQTRALAFSRLCGYEPQTQVTDMAALDLDQEAFEQELGINDMIQARNVYEQGGYSFSYAKLTLIHPRAANFSAGTEVIGRAHSTGEVKGTLMEHSVWDSSNGHNKTINVRYTTSNNQEKYVGCQVGGLYTFHDANLDGCFNDTGTIRFLPTGHGGNTNHSGYSYTYNMRMDNENARTLKSLSADANATMRKSESGCMVCPYLDDFQKFIDYYGDTTYADKWITAASDNTTTDFATGRGDADFQHYDFSTSGHAAAQARGTVLMTVFMTVIQQMEHAILECEKQHQQCSNSSSSSVIANSTSTHCPHNPMLALDSAVAYYAGSQQGSDGSGNGKMLYALADQMALRFATGGENGLEDEGEAWINQMIFHEFKKLQQYFMHGNCHEAKMSKEKIVNWMKVPLVQGVLSYAHTRQYNESPLRQVYEQDSAEGATFAAAVLPFVHACNANDAETIYQSMKVGANRSSVHFNQVKAAMERNYACMGVTCEAVGGVWTVNGYIDGAYPCQSSSSSSFSSGSNNSSKAGVIVGSIIGVMVCLGLASFLFVRTRQMKIRRDCDQYRHRSSNIAAVSDIA